MPLFKNRSFLVKMVKDEESNQENTVEVDIDEIRNHFKRNKNTYIAAGAGLTLAAGVYLAMRGSLQLPGPSNLPVIGDRMSSNVHPISLFNNRPINVTNINNQMERAQNFGGPMSKIVKCLETGDMWEKVTEAAAAAKNGDGVPLSVMSKHLNGYPGYDDIGQFHYKIVGLGTTG